MLTSTLKLAIDHLLSAVVDKKVMEDAQARVEQTIAAKVILDSVNPDNVRLTTMELTYPRMIHSEYMTHRVYSRNSASSRAIPLKTMIKRIRENPFVPLHWGKNQKGMQANTELPIEAQARAYLLWMAGQEFALLLAEALDVIGLHKQIGNRIVEPWMYITVIASATYWENFFALRCHKDAEPHMQVIAYKARNAYDASTSQQLVEWGDWHLPYANPELDNDIPKEDRPKICAGRCARVSYLTHDGVRDPAEDTKLYSTLSENWPMHASPLEHPCEALNPRTAQKRTYNYGNYSEERFDWGNLAPGWRQLRKLHPNENITERRKSA